MFCEQGPQITLFRIKMFYIIVTTHPSQTSKHKIDSRVNDLNQEFFQWKGTKDTNNSFWFYLENVKVLWRGGGFKMCPYKVCPKWKVEEPQNCTLFNLCQISFHFIKRDVFQNLNDHTIVSSIFAFKNNFKALFMKKRQVVEHYKLDCNSSLESRNLWNSD